MAIMQGNRFSGKIILASKTSYIDPGTYDIKSLSDLPISDREKYPQENIFGMYWIGIAGFYSIHIREQQWSEWRLDPNDGKDKIISRVERTPYLIIKEFEYAITTAEAEDKKGVPLDLVFTIIIIPVNAVKPIFNVDKGYEQLKRQAIAQANLYTREKTFESFNADNSTPDKINMDEFSDVMRELNDHIPGTKDKGIKETLGYEIRSAKIESISIAGENKKKLLGISTLKYEAEETGKALVIKKTAERDGKLLEADGERAMKKVDSDYLKEISTIPGASEIEKRRATPGLTTLIEEGGGRKTSIILGK